MRLNGFLTLRSVILNNQATLVKHYSDIQQPLALSETNNGGAEQFLLDLAIAGDGLRLTTVKGAEFEIFKERLGHWESLDLIL